MKEHTVCPYCHNEIDPEVCWCGEECKLHYPPSCGHNPVPMGCTCGYVDPRTVDSIISDLHKGELTPPKPPFPIPAKPQTLLEDEAEECGSLEDVPDRVSSCCPEARLMGDMDAGTIFHNQGSQYNWIVIRKVSGGVIASVLCYDDTIQAPRNFFSWYQLVQLNAMIDDNSFHPVTNLPCGLPVNTPDGGWVWDRTYQVATTEDGYSVNLCCERKVIKSWWIGSFERGIADINTPKIRKMIRLHEEFLKRLGEACEFKKA